jgi:PAS domain S-box-containing protein
MIPATSKKPSPDLEKKKQALLLRNLYRSFVDSAFAIIFRSSAVNDTVLFSNRLFIQRFGFSNFKKAKGFSVAELFDNPTIYASLKQKLLGNCQLQQVAVDFKTQDGKKIETLLNAQVQTNELGELVFNWIALDISERVEFERDLEQKNLQLAKVNNQMERFLYSTSHDLRAPITSIMGLVNLMKMDTLDINVIDYAKKIEASAFKLDKIIKDIINFSKTTYRNIHTELIDLESVIWKAINAHREDESFSRIKIDVEVSGEARFYSDLSRLEIVLDNLIRNAIQFTDINKVRPFLNINAVLMPEFATIEVHDNGVGIARQYFDQIFNMFFKASSLSKGAGLGLYIAKEGVEQLEGKISVQSEVGFGSVFKVFIPNSAKGRLINKKKKLENGD